MMYPYGYGGPFSGFAVLAMMVLGLLVLVVVVLLIVWAVRSGEQHRHMYGPPPGPPGPQAYVPGRDAAADAARERYARGEITKEQLDEVMRGLGY